MSNASEVAQIRALIELEITSMAHAAGFAEVARHEIIHGHFLRLEQHVMALSSFVGEENATTVLCEIYNEHNK